MTELHNKHRDWIEERGISGDLADKFGLSTVQKDGKAWLAVPYVERGKIVNHKYRLISDKQHQMDRGGKLTLWNHDCLLEESDRPVVICEGEWDALTAAGLGFRAVSVPNGASSGEGKLKYLWESRDLLKRVTKFILCTDSDEAGLKLRSNLVAHLGPGLCWFVDYGEGCKDLNEVLNTHGTEAARAVIDMAKPMPVQGIYSMDDFPDRPELTAWNIGIPAIEEMLYIVPGTLTIFTGYANMGKSTVMDSIIAKLLSSAIPVCLASFETDVKPIMRDDLRAAIMKCSKRDIKTRDCGEADAMISKHLHIITQMVDDENEMDLDQFIDLCIITVKRYGVRVMILDPWNELEHKNRPGETETQYIGRALRSIKRFAKMYDVAVWIVAHPAKPFEGISKMPSLLDISGSANWANKADFGLSYHRSNPLEGNDAELAITKIRKGYPGRRGLVNVSYDFRTSSFHKSDAPAAAMPNTKRGGR